MLKQLTARQEQNDEIIQALMDNLFVLDNHSAKMEMKMISHFGLFEDCMGEEHVVFIPYESLINTEMYPYCSVNEIVLGSDGLPHLSTKAVGGTLEFKRFGSLKKAVEGYNSENNPRYAGQFKLIASLAGSPNQEYLKSIH